MGSVGWRKKGDCVRAAKLEISNQEEFSSGVIIVDFREKTKVKVISLGEVDLICC